MDQDATKEFNMTVEIQNDNSASGQVVTIRYNREEKLNALDSVGIQELTNAFVSIGHRLSGMGLIIVLPVLLWMMYSTIVDVSQYAVLLNIAGTF